MDQNKQEEIKQQGRDHARVLVRIGSLLLVEGHWSCPGEVVQAPEEAILTDEEYNVWHAGYVAELQHLKQLRTAKVAHLPLSDAAEMTLEHYEHALDCDKTNHADCDITD